MNIIQFSANDKQIKSANVFLFSPATLPRAALIRHFFDLYPNRCFLACCSSRFLCPSIPLPHQCSLRTSVPCADLVYAGLRNSRNLCDSNSVECLHALPASPLQRASVCIGTIKLAHAPAFVRLIDLLLT